MMKQTKTEMNSRKLAGYFIHLGLIIGLATLTFGLSSCGGGGGDSAPAPIDTSMTITSITPPGIVASSVVQTLIIVGTNFPSGASISITNASGVPIASAVSVTSTVITADVKIDTAPTDRYVMVSVQAPSSGTPVDYVLGVAALRKTFADNISSLLQSNSVTNCKGCHSGTTSGGLDLSSANHLNSEPSQGCSSRFRVKRGDPRRSSSFLIDKIQATGGSPACYGNPMPNGGIQLQASEIQDIVDWVAGGAL
jgi:hypothetical protein